MYRTQKNIGGRRWYLPWPQAGDDIAPAKPQPRLSLVLRLGSVTALPGLSFCQPGCALCLNGSWAAPASRWVLGEVSGWLRTRNCCQIRLNRLGARCTHTWHRFAPSLALFTWLWFYWFSFYRHCIFICDYSVRCNSNSGCLVTLSNLLFTPHQMFRHTKY